MKYVLEFDIPRDKHDFIDAANGTTLRELLQEHVALLEEHCEGSRKSEARLAQVLLEDLKSKLSKMQKLPR